jgi:hypothetical protein
MRIQDELQQLSQIVSDNKIGDLSKEDLEKYANALCFSFASDHFGKHQFSQVCETIRLLLIKKYTEEIDRQNADMQSHNLILQEQNLSLQQQTTSLQKQNNRLQIIVIILTVVTIITGIIQGYAALKPNSQLQQQTELLKAISLQQKAAPTVQTTVSIPQNNPQKKPSKKETKR